MLLGKHCTIDCQDQINKIALKLKSMDTNYNACRNILKYKLKRIDSFVENRCNFSIINVLFPHIWQTKPKRDDPNYKIWSTKVTVFLKM